MSTTAEFRAVAGVPRVGPRLDSQTEAMDELELRDRALTGDNDAIGELVQLAGERGDLDLLRELTAAGSADAAAELVQLAAELGDLNELRRLASLGNSDAADLLLELDDAPAD